MTTTRGTHRPLLCVVGGFLGAGKTTALMGLARLFDADGRRVGFVTNDQADDLVDTESVRVRGFRVEQVAGACFCCKFDDLERAVETLNADERPDVLLAEPVGSCTDLAATVIAPFKRLNGQCYTVAPYSVLVDPARARQILLEKGFGGFSAKVVYVFRKQLEEANVICLSKSDLLEPKACDTLLDVLSRQFPRAQVIAISAVTGEGFLAWRSVLESGDAWTDNIVEVDYDTYGEGEAELAWLNLSLALFAERPFDGDDLVLDVVQRLTRDLEREGNEVAHVKVMVEAGKGAAVANVVRSGAPAMASQSLGVPVQHGRLLVNARVHGDPTVLHRLASQAVAETLRDRGVDGTVTRAAHFRPGKPIPTHRFGEADFGKVDG